MSHLSSSTPVCRVHMRFESCQHVAACSFTAGSLWFWMWQLHLRLSVRPLVALAPSELWNVTFTASCQGTNSDWESDFQIVATQRRCTFAQIQLVQMTESGFSLHLDSVFFNLMSRSGLGRSRLPSHHALAEKQFACTHSEKHIVTSSVWEEAAKLRVRVPQQTFSCPITHSQVEPHTVCDTIFLSVILKLKLYLARMLPYNIYSRFISLLCKYICWRGCPSFEVEFGPCCFWHFSWNNCEKCVILFFRTFYILDPQWLLWNRFGRFTLLNHHISANLMYHQWLHLYDWD